MPAETICWTGDDELADISLDCSLLAARADEEGGIIQIVTRNWDEQGVIIDIKDNGTGIARDKLGRVFNPFYSTKKQGEGTGLGLSVSYGLIRRYGGTIKVTSVEGVGTEFSVWLLREPELYEDEAMLAEQLHIT